MKKQGSGRSMFLLEIGALLLFFLISAVVCVSLFVFSSQKNTDANDLNSAVIKAISITDTIKASKTDLDRAKKILKADKNFDIYFDGEWKQGEEKAYRASVSCRPKRNLLAVTVTFTRLSDNKEIYRLETKEFLWEGAK